MKVKCINASGSRGLLKVGQVYNINPLLNATYKDEVHYEIGGHRWRMSRFEVIDEKQPAR